MKAIQITEQNKINFPNFEVGKRYKVTIPKRYRIGNDTFERYDLRTERHESDGFLDLTIPEYNSETQRLGEIIETANGYTYERIDKSEAEIQANEDAIKDAILEAEKQLYLKRISDGKTYYAQVSAQFRLARLAGQLSTEQHAGIENIYRPVRDEILAGQWLTAKELATAIDINIVGEDIYNQILDKITQYVSENY
jgi:nitrogen regulatory protein PII